MDSWIYAVLTRLQAMGYITGQAAGIRPWTRSQCARQLREAEQTLAAAREKNDSEAASLIAALQREFGRERESSSFIALESLYSRSLVTAGRPLVDGYNFGQTVFNDYGRPSGQGVNTIAGFSADAVVGRFSFFTRAEYQHSASFFSRALELKPEAPQLQPVVAASAGGLDRIVPIEAYLGIQLGNWALTVGKQELWWGPGEAGPLAFSTNAEPFYCFRLTSTDPIRLPGALRLLGDFRLDFVGGELSGHRLPARPLLNGQKLTWNITPHLEVGFTRWSLFGGAGVHGFTAGSLIRNLFANGATFGRAVDPGDRKSGFDFRWRLPWYPATIYSDFYADDEPSPLASPRRSAFSPGIYFARLPGLAKWDLRVEMPSTRLATIDKGGMFLYWNSVYNDANTNRGNPLGSWVGRDGRGLLAEAGWWRTARSRLVISWRQNRIGPAFLPGGGTQSDASVRAAFLPRPDWEAAISAQYERYSIPVLGGARQNLSLSLLLRYSPRLRWPRIDKANTTFTGTSQHGYKNIESDLQNSASNGP